MKKLAVIDLGSNSVRMSIFEFSSGGLKAVANYRNAVKLSEGMGEKMQLAVQAQVRTAAVLRRYKNIIDAEKVTDVCAVATAAVRKAKNKLEFIKFVKESAGIEIRIIEGEQEAALDALAASRMIGCEFGVICDIGGGSTELIGIKDGRCRFAESIPIGSRSVSEKFFGKGETADLRIDAQRYVDEAVGRTEGLSEFSRAAVIGIGGTLRAVAKFDTGESDNLQMKGYKISDRRMAEIIDLIENSSVAQRAAMQGIGKERADIIGGGLLFVRSLLKRLSPNEFVIADVGVREGVAFDFFENTGILRIK